MTTIQLKTLDSNNTKFNDFSEIDDVSIRHIIGGNRLPDGNEWPYLLALYDTLPKTTLDMVGAIRDGQNLFINLAVFTKDANGNIVVRFNI